MSEVERLRQRLAAAGGHLPDQLLAVVALTAGPLAAAHDSLLALDLRDVEPFCPARRLPDDTAT
jgi:hypothetical protein